MERDLVKRASRAWKACGARKGVGCKSSSFRMTLEEYQTSWNQATWKSFREQLGEYPELGRTNWTRSKVKVLSERHDAHIDSCDECQDGLAIECPEPESHDECLEDPEHACYLTGYCPIGQSTMTTWLDASQEFSWQPGFTGED